MSKILLMVDQVGPLVGAIRNDLKLSGFDTLTFNTREQKFMGTSGQSIPAWARGRESYEATKWFKKLLSMNDIQSLIAVGRESVVYASRLSRIVRVIGVLKPGDLDISSKRKRLISDFQNASNKVHALVFLNEWEMTKACTLGSRAPHLLWDLNSIAIEDWPNSATIEEDSRVAIVDYSAEGPALMQASESIKSDGSTKSHDFDNFEPISSNSMYWYSDLQIDREFRNTLKLRGSQYSGVIFADDNADALTLMALAGSATTIAPPTIAANLLAANNPNITLANVKQALSNNLHKTPVAEKPKPPHTGRPLVAILEICQHERLPWFSEDYGDIDKFNIFLSVAAVENASNGARPQRIRNMFLAARRDAPTIQMSFNSHLLDRRVKWFYAQAERGVQFPVLYGENSTNPVMDFDAVYKVTRLVEYLERSCGTRSLYFVRDVHWLDTQIQSKDDKVVARQKKYGQFELKNLSRAFGGLVAPSKESAANYTTLAKPLFNLEFINDELPPGIALENTRLPQEVTGDSNGVTFVYTGGVSKLYSMDTYLHALKSIFDKHPQGVFADFIVRPNEQPLLQEWMLEAGITENSNIRILNGNFSDYAPRTTKNIGILLLDSEYGRKAFAFKAMSYLEKSMPFVVYEDSPNCRYFQHYGVALPVKDPESLVDVLEKSLSHPCNLATIQELWEQESWDARWRKVKQLASTSDHEIR